MKNAVESSYWRICEGDQIIFKPEGRFDFPASHIIFTAPLGWNDKAKQMCNSFRVLHRLQAVEYSTTDGSCQ